MENTLENKAKFFAKSLGSEIEIDSELFTTEGVNGIITDKLISVSLNLEVETTKYSASIVDAKMVKTPIYLMTDEDAIKAARIALYHPDNDDWCENDVWVGEGDFDNIGNHTLEIGTKDWQGVLTINDKTGAVKITDDDRDEHIYNALLLTDYLRLKDYALPSMGLSVDEMDEYGWIKLKEVNNG
jgi:hypothetical protein